MEQWPTLFRRWFLARYCDPGALREWLGLFGANRAWRALVGECCAPEVVRERCWSCFRVRVDRLIGVGVAIYEFKLWSWNKLPGWRVARFALCLTTRLTQTRCWMEALCYDERYVTWADLADTYQREYAAGRNSRVPGRWPAATLQHMENTWRERRKLGRELGIEG